MAKIFVDGAYGTVGLNLKPYLAELQASGVLDHVISLGPTDYKSETARAHAMKDADLIVFCLPDHAARDAVALAQEEAPHAKLLDASAAFRCHEQWLYGLPELGHKAEIQAAPYVANPGCIATGCILIAKPIAAKLDWHGIDAPWMSFVGVTGYSAMGSHGKQMDGGITAVQLGESHRHLPEIRQYGNVYPALSVMVGN